MIWATLIAMSTIGYFTIVGMGVKWDEYKQRKRRLLGVQNLPVKEIEDNKEKPVAVWLPDNVETIDTVEEKEQDFPY